jgi:serine/threonine protein kinase/formylglycine-generating enzyme required for sulfatase activity
MSDKSFGEEPTRMPTEPSEKKDVLKAGDMLESYRIIELLGRGGMGEVYLAENRVDGSRVALKVISRDASGPGFLERFRVESRVMSGLRHPNIVQVHHAGESNGIYYLTMDYISGPDGKPRTLADELEEAGNKGLPESRVRELLGQLLAGLSAAHEKGVVHRDLKPANLLLDAEGNLHIADFGLAKVVGEEFVSQMVKRSISVSMGRSIGEKETEVPGSSKRAQYEGTSTGAILGTYDYMSPEQKVGAEVTKQSDLYSVGVILYRMLTGRKPQGMAKPPSYYGCPEKWDGIVNRLLEEAFLDRYAATEDVMGDIRGSAVEDMVQIPCLGRSVSIHDLLPETEVSDLWSARISCSEGGLSFTFPNLEAAFQKSMDAYIGLCLPALLTQSPLRCLEQLLKGSEGVYAVDAVNRLREVLFTSPQVFVKDRLTELASQKYSEYLKPVRITFNRTLRIPEDGNEYPLPPGLGHFPLMRVKDCGWKAPEAMRNKGGVMLPLYQAEALWIGLSAGIPVALKIGTGKINAISGLPWADGFHRDPQNYVVLPEQQWIDGYCVEAGVVRQFVASRFGDGRTVEEQISGTDFGGIQFELVPIRFRVLLESLLEALPENLNALLEGYLDEYILDSGVRYQLSDEFMGLGAGGRIKQQIFEDPWSLEDWEVDASRRAWLHLVDVKSWRRLTGDRPPQKPPSARQYAKAGLPWFYEYRDDRRSLPGSKAFSKIRSAVGPKETPQIPGNQGLNIKNVIDLGKQQDDGSVSEWDGSAEEVLGDLEKLKLKGMKKGVSGRDAETRRGKGVGLLVVGCLLLVGGWWWRQGRMGIPARQEVESVPEVGTPTREPTAMPEVAVAPVEASRIAIQPESRLLPEPSATPELEEVKGPVVGQNWTSPETRMEFVWIKDLNVWVGKYEVTNGEYRKFKRDHDSKAYEGHSLNGDRQPVVSVNFDDAKAYAAWMTERDRVVGLLPEGYRYRLPADKEWEAYTKSGKNWEYPWGNNWPPKSWEAGNYPDSKTKQSFSGWDVISGYTDGYAVTAPVEKSWANPWGLYGLGGNVWEIAAKDATNSSFGAWRGGSWSTHDQDYLRCSYRYDFDGSYRRGNGGFRLLLSQPSP